MTIKSSSQAGYMLDTTEFNAIAKGQVEFSKYAGKRLFATHAQFDELAKTPDVKLRNELLRTFEKVAAERLPTESAVWDVSKWDEAKWSAEDGMFGGMLARLEELDGRKLHPKQSYDILIAETAIKNGLTLISGDRKLRKVTEEFRGSVIDPPRK